MPTKRATADDLARAVQIVEELAALIRETKAYADERSAEASAAIERNAEAQAALSALVMPYRELCTALVNSAGHDRKHPLPEAIAAAEAVLA